MTGAAIADGDLVVIRQQESAENGEIVAARLDRDGTSQATVKTLQRLDGHAWLMPHNPAYQPDPGRRRRHPRQGRRRLAPGCQLGKVFSAGQNAWGQGALPAARPAALRRLKTSRRASRGSRYR